MYVRVSSALLCSMVLGWSLFIALGRMISMNRCVCVCVCVKDYCNVYMCGVYDFVCT
jgi:hypothetical protein